MKIIKKYEYRNKINKIIKIEANQNMIKFEKKLYLI